jgi:hypothetical protein
MKKIEAVIPASRVDAVREELCRRGAVGEAYDRRSSGVNAAVPRAHQSVRAICTRSCAPFIPGGCVTRSQTPGDLSGFGSGRCFPGEYEQAMRSFRGPVMLIGSYRSFPCVAPTRRNERAVFGRQLYRRVVRLAS